jgi:DNA gyrase/topoisomerase IV subunit A
MIIRQQAKNIRLSGRNTQGVRLIKLEESDSIAALAVVAAEENGNGDSNGFSSTPPQDDDRNDFFIPKEELKSEKTLKDKQAYQKVSNSKRENNLPKKRGRPRGRE